jgi:hypothetical protein
LTRVRTEYKEYKDEHNDKDKKTKDKNKDNDYVEDDGKTVPSDELDDSLSFRGGSLGGGGAVKFKV